MSKHPFATGKKYLVNNIALNNLTSLTIKDSTTNFGSRGSAMKFNVAYQNNKHPESLITIPILQHVL
jgi:hypothetical protein